MMRCAYPILLVLVVALAGCGAADSMRREFVATRYMQAAQRHLSDLPRQTSRAEAELDRAVALMPENEELERRAARLYVLARAYEKAVPLLEDQASLDLDARALLGQSLLRTGARERGTRICLRVIAEARRLREQREIDLREWALLLNDAGYVLVDAEAAVAEAHEAVRQAAEAFPLQPAFVDSLGWALFRENDLTEATFYLERAGRLLARDDPEILYHLGVVYSRRGRFAEAERALKQARLLDPDFQPIQEELRRLGRILLPLPLAALPPGLVGAGDATGRPVPHRARTSGG